jgi:hypothetical protein
MIRHPSAAATLTLRTGDAGVALDVPRALRCGPGEGAESGWILVMVGYSLMSRLRR